MPQDKLFSWYRRPIIWQGLYLLAGSVLLHYAVGNWHYDDPFITYRYAANLHGGIGMVFNPGERILSTTSPLFALLLAAVRFTGVEIHTAANLATHLSIMLGGLFIWKIGSETGESFLGAAGLLLYPTASILASTTGSEIPVYLALCLAAVGFYLSGRFFTMGLLAGLATLARADALLVGGLILVDWLVRNRPAVFSRDRSIWRQPLRAAAGFLIVILPWLLWSGFYFSSPVPVTLATKRAQALLPFSVSFLDGFWELLGNLGRSAHFWLLGILFLIGLLCSLFRRHRLLFVLFWPVVHVLAYHLLSVTKFHWYYATIVPGFVIGVGAAIEALVGFARQREAYRAFGGAAAAVLLAILFFAQIRDIIGLQNILDPRYEVYRDIGEWLADYSETGSTVATLEVGIIGYFSPNNVIVDFSGLLQPDVASVFSSETTYDDSALVLAKTYHPDFFVLFPEMFSQLESEYVKQRCVPVRFIPAEKFLFTRDMIIYQCEG